MDAAAILKSHGQATDTYLRQVLARYASAPKRLIEAVEYSLMAGGKRLRPALVLECARAAGNGKTTPPAALAAAGAMELIHTFSLVHDDLPAMDNDDLRRGRPTNHKVFGDAMAILAGDAMVTMAFEALAVDGGQQAGRMVKELASASGPEGMIGGQVLDMEGENKGLSLAELQQVHRLKTGALLRCACRLGAVAVGASEANLAAISDYGRHIGLAFQIVDDLLDVTATPEQMGKATGKDQKKGKNTYPSLLGIEGSKEQAQQQLSAAVQALTPLGPAAEGLRILAEFVVHRAF